MCSLHNTLTKGERSKTRLSTVVIPSHYRLRIRPDIEAATFSGDESISLTVCETVTSIVLHAAELEITKAVLRNDAGTSFEAAVALDEAKQLARLNLNGQAGAGQWTLELSFAGILNNKLRGFYRSSFKDADGNEKFIATTKFEPSDARRAFPCFDEPEFKAVFEISLEIDQKLTAISNSPLIAEKPLAEGKKLLQFAPSIKMSSYLVAYVVGDFEANNLVYAESGIPIRVWCVPGKKELSAFALAWAKSSLDYFADYFGINYPGQKLDLIAIPDFASGAMENFGCITFRETALLLDESKATHAEKLRVAEVISHENAHMWFGDLVTMDWWNGLWLNEAFATFMAAKAVHDRAPEWKFWEAFNIEKAGAMRIDGLHASRSIEFPVESPEDARAMFDVLTYEKGCAILRMLELYIGEETFRKGCAGYMAKHAYANTQTADLWTAIEKAVQDAGSKIPVGKMMDSWVYQKGFPLVSVEGGESAGSITLRQRPFRFLKEDQTDAKQLWYVPVFIRSAGKDGVRSEYLALESAEQSFYLGENPATVVLNADGKGFYRVAYAAEMRAHLLGSLAELSAPERFNLISDLWAQAQAGELSLADYLESLKTLLATETDNNVFSVATGSIAYLRRICKAGDPALYDNYCHLVASLLKPAFARLGWQAAAGESPQAAELRSSLVSTLAALGDPQVKAKVAELWNAYLKDRASLDANLLPAVVEATAASGDEAAYEQFLKLKASAATPQEEARFLMALASFRKPELIARTLDATINGSIRTQDAPQMLRALFLNPEGGPATWQFVKANWQKLVSMLPLQGVIRLCDGITALVDPELEDEIRRFFAENNVKGNEKALAQNLETLSIANKFLVREKTALKSLF